MLFALPLALALSVLPSSLAGTALKQHVERATLDVCANVNAGLKVVSSLTGLPVAVGDIGAHLRQALSSMVY